MNDQEIWLPIPEREGYEISNLGKVRWRNRIRTATNDRQGYPQISFWTDKGSRKVSVHTIVASVFIGKRPPGAIIRHKNGINSDCRAANLCYGTHAENEADKDAHGTKINGTKHHSNKLTESDILAIRSRYISRDKANSLHALGNEFDVSAKTIERIVKRVTWKHIP